MDRSKLFAVLTSRLSDGKQHHPNVGYRTVVFVPDRSCQARPSRADRNVQGNIGSATDIESIC